MGNISVKVEGHEALLKRIKELSAIDTGGAMRAIAEGLRTSTMERFDTTTDPEGKRWKASIRARESAGKTLTKSARLKNSIRAEADKTGMAVGTNTIYAATHQFGAKGRVIKAKRAKALRFKFNGQWVSVKKVQVDIPARPFLGISAEDDKEIQETLDDMIRG